MKTLRDLRLQDLLLCAILAIGLQACSKDDGANPVLPSTHQRGDIVASNSLGTMTAASIQQLLAATNFQLPFALDYTVEAVSIQYSTVDGGGKETIASGALFLPQGVNNLPMISLQHGTASKYTSVASVSPTTVTEGIVGLIMASLGYVVVVPDYLGFGVSRGVHPYLHARSLVPCVIDFMRAGRRFCSARQLSLDGQVFLTGYSEGGFLSLATQKVIEENHSAEFALRAVAPLSGPYDLHGMTQKIFQSGTYSSPAYIAYFLTAYNNVYGWNRLDAMFKEPYASMMPGLFDGSKSWGEIEGRLPATFTGLVDPTFVSNCLTGNEQEVLAAIQENTLLDWTPRTPMHFFHGDADDIVPYENALVAVNAFTSRGASNIQLTTISGGTHETAGPYAAIGAIQWFESM